MQLQEAKEKAHWLIKKANGGTTPPYRNFLELAQLAADAALDFPAKEREKLKWFTDWATTWRKLHDNYDKIVIADPMVQYEPAHKVALEFHSSPAFIRYFRAGNRCSKTQSGYAEHYLYLTGQHKWRKVIRPPLATFIVGVDYKHYSHGVFEAKFIEGEVDNPLSPMFPAGGKWLYHYDDRKHIVTIACPNCAEAGKAGTCSHPKSTCQLFSDEGSYEQLMGAQYALGHFDEHVDVGFFKEGIQRTKTVTNAGLIVTGTPLHGHEAWEHQKLTKRWLNGGKNNLSDPEDPQSPQWVSIHEISQWDAGIVPHAKIRQDMATYDEFEIEARVYGRPAPFTDTPVFDRRKLAVMRGLIKEPWRGVLKSPVKLQEVTPVTIFEKEEDKNGELRIWKEPENGATYICAVDTAAGLRDGDASCASLLKVGRLGTRLTLELVAQWHGWLNPLAYADEVFKLCVWYNSALCVIELTGGLGRGVMLVLKDEYHYWNLYRERTDFTNAAFSLDPRFGVDTNAGSKPFMVAALQMLLCEDRILVPCEATIQELSAYEQETVSRDGKKLASPKFQGAKGSADDRTMSLVIGAAVATSHTSLLYEVQHKETLSLDNKPLPIFWKELYKELKDPGYDT